MPQVSLQGVTKVYPGGQRALDAVDLEVADGELFVIVGPSGSGKSTLLRSIAGLETPNTGTIWIGKQRVDRLPPRDRDVAMVFQNPALYPHLSVFGNLAFGLRARRIATPEVGARVASIAERLGLTEILRRRPATLSGGQRQRVALGRALARSPRVFLLDEPFSSLDAPLRAALRAELIELHRRIGATMLHVTHDQAEALAIGDRIAVMDRGRIVQSGTPLDVYDRPSCRFVAEFVGSPPMNLLPCVVERSEDSSRIRIDGTELTVGAAPAQFPTRLDLGIRPEHIHVQRGDGRDAEPTVLTAAVEVRRLEPLGHETLVTMALGPHALIARVAPHTCPAIGQRMEITLDTAQIAWFDGQKGAVIGPERAVTNCPHQADGIA